MKTFEEPLYDSSEFRSIKEHLKSSNETIALTGNIDSQQVNLMSAITKDYKYSVVVTHSDKRAREIYEDYLLYDKSVIYYPAKDFIF